MMNHFPRFFLVSIIKVYQKTLSMDHGPLRHLHPEGYCRFKPSCSQYGIEAVEQFGVIKGGGKTLWRVARCNPWNDGGYDSPVQKKADDQN